MEGGQVDHVRTDHIGRPVPVPDAAGAVVGTAAHLPFGGVLATTEAMHAP